MKEDGKIDYVEFSGGDMAQTQSFYKAAFGWSFVDYGDSYAAFAEGLDGGFDSDAERLKAPLVVLYAADLEAMVEKVVAGGGRIVRPIFDFPDGRRFHFCDPAGNELAVHTEV